MQLFDKKISDFFTVEDFSRLKAFVPTTRDEFHRHMQTVYNLKLETEFPLVVHIETTNFCNQTCIMCQHPDMKREKMHIDPELAKKAIDEIAAQGKCWFVHFFFFGEPFLNSRTLEYIRYAKEQGIENISVTTNFTSVTTAIIDQIVALGITSLVISFEGLDRQRYQQVRGVDSYDKVVANLAYLRERRAQTASGKPWISLTYVRTSETDEEIARFQDQWGDQVDALHISPQFEYLGRSQLARSGQTVNSGDILGRGRDQRLPCRQLWLRLVVLSNGEIVPCSQNMDGELSLGNLREVSLAEAWQGNTMAALRMQHLNNSYQPDCVCGECVDWDWSGKVDKRPTIKVQDK